MGPDKLSLVCISLPIAARIALKDNMIAAPLNSPIDRYWVTRYVTVSMLPTTAPIHSAATAEGASAQIIIGPIQGEALWVP